MAPALNEYAQYLPPILGSIGALIPLLIYSAINELPKKQTMLVFAGFGITVWLSYLLTIALCSHVGFDSWTTVVFLMLSLVALIGLFAFSFQAADESEAAPEEEEAPVDESEAAAEDEEEAEAEAEGLLEPAEAEAGEPELPAEEDAPDEPAGEKTKAVFRTSMKQRQTYAILAGLYLLVVVLVTGAATSFFALGNSIVITIRSEKRVEYVEIQNRESAAPPAPAVGAGAGAGESGGENTGGEAPATGSSAGVAGTITRKFRLPAKGIFGTNFVIVRPADFNVKTDRIEVKFKDQQQVDIVEGGDLAPEAEQWMIGARYFYQP